MIGCLTETTITLQGAYFVIKVPSQTTYVDDKQTSYFFIRFASKTADIAIDIVFWW